MPPRTVPIYGSGGFTSYADERLREQLAGWVEHDGCRWVKMKIGSDPARDPARVEPAHATRSAMPVCSSMPMAPSRRNRRWRWPSASREHDVTWFEEPVSSDDLDGLALMRAARAGWDGYRRRRIRLQPRRFPSPRSPGRRSMCCRPTRHAAAASPVFCRSPRYARRITSISRGHCAPALHLPCRLRRAPAAASRMVSRPCPHRAACCSTAHRHPHDGAIAPDLSRPGLGLVFKERDAERFRIG